MLAEWPVTDNTEPTWTRRAADCRSILRDDSQYSTQAYTAMWRDLSGIPIFANLDTRTRSALRAVILRTFAGHRHRTEQFGGARQAIGECLAGLGPSARQDVMPMIRQAQFACTLRATGVDQELALAALDVYREARVHIAACDAASAVAQDWRDLAREAANLAALGSLEQAGPASLLGQLRSTAPEFAGRYAGLLVGGFLDTLANSIDQDLPVTCIARVAGCAPETQRRLRNECDARLAAFETVRLQSDKVLVRTQTGEQSPGRLHVLDLSAADRDPAMFGSPLKFNPWRSELGRLLGFGAGSHVCPGRDLAVSLAAGILVGLLEAGPLSSSADEGFAARVTLGRWDA